MTEHEKLRNTDAASDLQGRKKSKMKKEDQTEGGGMDHWETDPRRRCELEKGAEFTRR